MVSPLRRYVLVDDIVSIIFEELDSKWLQSMWDSDGDTCREMIKIFYLIYLFKSRS
jgi:hypothetical protein